MEKRLPLALALSILFVMLYLQSVPRPPEPEPGQEAGQTQVGDAGEGLQRPPAVGVDPNRPVPAGAPVGDAPAPLAIPAAGPAPARVSETLVGAASRSTWTSLGGGLSRFELLDLHPSTHSDEPLLLLDELDGSTPNLLLRDVVGSYGLDRVDWSVQRLPATDGRERLQFTHRAADGLVFTRTVEPGKQRYVETLSLTVRNEGSQRLDSLSLVLQGARGLVDYDASSRFYGQPTALAVLRPAAGGKDQVVTWRGKDLRGEGRGVGSDELLLAAGTMTNYFTSVLVPHEGTDVRQVYPLPVDDALKLERLVAEKLPADEREAARWRAELAEDSHEAAGVDLQFLVLGLDPGSEQHFEFDLFSGPKAPELAELPELAFLHPLIESAYGMWSWINKSLLSILRFFHGIFGNWGVAIILLTVLVRGLLFPLNRRQQTSMTRYSTVMQRVKPQLDELKAKYKNNQRKFQEEQMKLLKEHGATPPLGGCLLTFLQFPVWISLFQILGTSFELRQSAFVGWVDDLSRPDAMPFGFFGLATINLLPLLMSVATVVQMRFQPKPADAQQQQTQKVMGTLMPLLMLWFLYRYSAGLSLYILTSSLLGIFEFRVIRRVWPLDLGPGSGKAVAKPAPKPAVKAPRS